MRSRRGGSGGGGTLEWERERGFGMGNGCSNPRSKVMCLSRHSLGPGPSLEARAKVNPVNSR